MTVIRGVKKREREGHETSRAYNNTGNNKNILINTHLRMKFRCASSYIEIIFKYLIYFTLVFPLNKKENHCL